MSRMSSKPPGLGPRAGPGAKCAWCWWIWQEHSSGVLWYSEDKPFHPRKTSRKKHDRSLVFSTVFGGESGPNNNKRVSLTNPQNTCIAALPYAWSKSELWMAWITPSSYESFERSPFLGSCSLPIGIKWHSFNASNKFKSPCAVPQCSKHLHQ